MNLQEKAEDKLAKEFSKWAVKNYKSSHSGLWINKSTGQIKNIYQIVLEFGELGEDAR